MKIIIQNIVRVGYKRDYSYYKWIWILRVHIWNAFPCIQCLYSSHLGWIQLRSWDNSHVSSPFNQVKEDNVLTPACMDMWPWFIALTLCLITLYDIVFSIVVRSYDRWSRECCSITSDTVNSQNILIITM